MGAQTFKSNKFLAWEISRSEIDMIRPPPALLTRISRWGSLETQILIDVWERTSRERVSMPAFLIFVILDVSRAVAYTWRPPSEQPVIRTVRREFDIVLLTGRWELMESSRDELVLFLSLAPLIGRVWRIR